MSEIKVVGRRKVDHFDWEDVRRLLHTAAALRGGPGIVPRGVFRFSTFDEADEWMTQQMARTHAHRSSRISSESAAR